MPYFVRWIRKYQNYFFVLILCIYILSLVIYYPFYNQLRLSLERSAPEIFYLARLVSPGNKYFPIIPPKKSYSIILIGDSLTDILGLYGDQLRKDLRFYYPDKNINVENYGFGSTNILSVDQRLEKTTIYNGRTFSPILSKDFDLVLIESFGNNPLSQYPLEEGLKKQNDALDKIVNKINKTHPHSVIAFVATIAPLKDAYGKGAINLTNEQRQAFVNERIAYIKNHILYAQKHNIPLINIYKDSLTPLGDGNPNFFNESDHIHPNQNGVDFISQEISDFIFLNRVFPL